MASVSASTLYPGSTCGHNASHNPRNLAVFVDGTSKKLGNKVIRFATSRLSIADPRSLLQNTNVLKLYERVVDGSLVEGSRVEQHKYYLKGIGAYDVDHLPVRKRAANAAYCLLENGFAWFVPRQRVSRH